MAKIATCEYCGKNGPSEQKFGINFCIDCYDAIIKKNKAYFESKDSSRATDRAKKEVESALLTDEEIAELARKVKEANDLKAQQLEEYKQRIHARCTTTNSFEDATIEEYFGVVSGADYYLAGGIIGEGLMRQAALFGKALSNAKLKMLQEAENYGANAIVGISHSLTDISNGNMVVVVTGTAVRIKEKE